MAATEHTATTEHTAAAEHTAAEHTPAGPAEPPAAGPPVAELLGVRNGGSASVLLVRFPGEARVWALKVFRREAFGGRLPRGDPRPFRRAYAADEALFHRIFARALGGAYRRLFVPLAVEGVQALPWLPPPQRAALGLGRRLPALALAFAPGGEPLSAALAPRLEPAAPHLGRLFGLLPALRARGLMHGDLKAENLLFSGGELRVIDLGIAACARRPFLGLLELFLARGTVYGHWPLDFFLASGRPASSLGAEELKTLAAGELPERFRFGPDAGWDGTEASLERLRAALWRRYGRGAGGLPAFLSGIDVFMVGRLVLAFAGWGLGVSPPLLALGAAMASFDPCRRPSAGEAAEAFRSTPEGRWLACGPAAPHAPPGGPVGGSPLA